MGFFFMTFVFCEQNHSEMGNLLLIVVTELVIALIQDRLPTVIPIVIGIGTGWLFSIA